MSLEGKVVAITGASAGVGRSCAREFARRGSPQLWPATHTRPLAAAAGAALAAGQLARRARSHR